VQFPWFAQASIHSNSSLILTQADIEALHQRALALCDGNVGLVDGIMDLGYSYNFDPVTILCSNTSTNSTTPRLSNVDKVHATQKIAATPATNSAPASTPATYPAPNSNGPHEQTSMAGHLPNP